MTRCDVKACYNQSENTGSQWGKFGFCGMIYANREVAYV